MIMILVKLRKALNRCTYLFELFLYIIALSLAAFTKYYKYGRGGAVYTMGKASLIAHPHLFALLGGSILLSLMKIYAYCTQSFSNIVWLRVFQLNGHYLQIIFSSCTFFAWGDRVHHAEAITVGIIVLHAYQVIEDVQELFIRLEEANYAKIMRRIQQLEPDIPVKKKTPIKKTSFVEIEPYKTKIAAGFTQMHVGFANVEVDDSALTNRNFKLPIDYENSRKMSILRESYGDGKSEAYVNGAMDRSDSTSALSSYKTVFPESKQPGRTNGSKGRKRKSRGHVLGDDNLGRQDRLKLLPVITGRPNLRELHNYKTPRTTGSGSSGRTSIQYNQRIQLQTQ